MTKELLRKLSLWAGLNKEVREAIEYRVREGKTECELWFKEDNYTIKILNELGFEVETVAKEHITWRYLSIRWDKLQ